MEITKRNGRYVCPCGSTYDNLDSFCFYLPVVACEACEDKYHIEWDKKQHRYVAEAKKD